MCVDPPPPKKKKKPTKQQQNFTNFFYFYSINCKYTGSTLKLLRTEAQVSIHHDCPHQKAQNMITLLYTRSFPQKRAYKHLSDNAGWLCPNQLTRLSTWGPWSTFGLSYDHVGFNQFLREWTTEIVYPIATPTETDQIRVSCRIESDSGFKCSIIVHLNAESVCGCLCSIVYRLSFFFSSFLWFQSPALPLWRELGIKQV